MERLRTSIVKKFYLFSGRIGSLDIEEISKGTIATNDETRDLLF